MTDTMQGVVNYGQEPLSVEMRDLPIPTIGEEDVLLAVQAVGVCGSDLHQYHGRQSWKVNYPVVLGHEFAGVIAQIGTRVRNFKEGDRVVSETAAVLDTASPFYRSGQYNLDPNRLGFGYGVSGAMTQFVRVPERCLHRLPDTLPFEKAALTEPCCVAYNAVCVNSHIRPGDSVVVIGPGPIGLLCALMAKLSGADPLIVVGVPADAKRLEAARQVGATQTLGASGEDVAAQVKALGDGYGVDVVIDAAGISATLQLALDIVRPGGQVTKVGWGPQPYGASLDPLVQKGVTLQGSYSHNWPMWKRVIGMLASGQIDLGPVLNRVSPLSEWRDSFEAMHRGEIVKAVLVP
ncbi:MAG: zinc-binding dehydrogenase [Janthinobacterium lividum]